MARTGSSRIGCTRGISAMVERQVRNWELACQQRRKASKKPPTGATSVKFYVAISRECGCDDTKIIDAVAKKTGFEKYDKEILDYMVARDDVRRRLYETLDDQTVGWIEDVTSSLVMGPAVGEVEYFHRLCHALLAICHNTHAIAVGRAANFILPRTEGLAVRLVAPRNYRLEHHAKQAKLQLADAQKQIEQIDAARSRFIEHHFGRYAYDPRRYDIVINVSQFSQEATAEIIVSAIRAKAGGALKLPVSPIERRT